MESLSGKTLVMVVGPTAVGKSTLMNQVVKFDERFGRVRSFTTRPARDNDEPGHYFYLTRDELDDKRSRGEVLTDIVSPATGHHYGTVSKSFDNEYNLLDTFAHSVEDYKKLPFERSIIISLTTDPVAWRSWLSQRFPSGGSELQSRIGEAMTSIEWSLQQRSDHYWIVNLQDSLEESAQRLIDIVTMRPAIDVAPPQAAQLYTAAKHLVSYE